MRYEIRLRRLEARRRQPVSHFLSVAYYPWHWGEPNDDWWRALVCPCDQRGCPELRVGASVPEKAPSPEAWAERARQYQEERPHG
jgi:hypothetical protein